MSNKFGNIVKFSEKKVILGEFETYFVTYLKIIIPIKNFMR
jgi:hypothetical protein